LEDAGEGGGGGGGGGGERRSASATSMSRCSNRESKSSLYLRDERLQQL